MKKKIFLIGVLLFFYSVSWANNCENNQKISDAPCCECKNECQEKLQKNSCDEEKCDKKDKEKLDKFEIEDDEYFTYNQCFFDKRYRKMKSVLCLTKRQESCMDSIYNNFKSDMENLYDKYRIQRDKLLKNIECEQCQYKENKKCLKELKREAKEKYKDFKQDIEELLCKKQKSDFRKYQKGEKRKIKKIAKYSKVYKFPCINCCSE